MFIVADTTDHKLQIVNIPDTIYASRAANSNSVYSGFGKCHNIFINEDTGYLYAVGTNTCSGGLHIVDVSDPANPKQAGCFEHAGSSSYIHDVQCVVYHGPDTRYKGREICVA